MAYDTLYDMIYDMLSYMLYDMLYDMLYVMIYEEKSTKCGGWHFKGLVAPARKMFTKLP